ncbi:MAG: hypothetical protein H7X93_10775 [Sphingomonadaceae bacterium]|nr:hypothetical protein [Sphingomonadaceae bacterium]
MLARICGICSLLALAACQPADAQEQANVAVPAAEDEGPFSEVRAVRIGLGGADMDACMSQGVVTAGPDAPVLAAPDPAAAELERLPAGLIVHLCDEADGWIGVAYATEGDPWVSCETGSPVPAVVDYPGPCRSGWIAAERVEVTAG